MIIATAFAQVAASGGAPSGFTALMLQIAPFAAVFLIFYFLVLRPQQKRASDHKAMIEAVKKGDSVVTGGGLMGKVTRVDADAIEVEIAPNVRVRVVKGTLTDVTSSGKKPAND